MKNKNCLLVMLIALMAVAVSTQATNQIKKPNAPKRTNWENDEAPLYGNVASIRVEFGTNCGTYTFNEAGHVSSIVDNKSGEKEYYQYDSFGNVTHIAPEPGVSYPTFEYEYDSMGNIITKRSPGVCTDEYKYKYDSNGKIIEKKSSTLWMNSSNEPLVKQNFYKYDNNGNLVEESNSFGTKVTYQYDYHKNLIEEQRYDNNELNKRILYRYDSANNVIEESHYNSDGKLEYKEVNKYDLTGNLIEKLFYNSNGLIEQRMYMKYDTIGNIIEVGTLNDIGNPINKIASFYITYR